MLSFFKLELDFIISVCQNKHPQKKSHDYDDKNFMLQVHCLGNSAFKSAFIIEKKLNMITHFLLQLFCKICN